MPSKKVILIGFEVNVLRNWTNVCFYHLLFSDFGFLERENNLVKYLQCGIFFYTSRLIFSVSRVFLFPSLSIESRIRKVKVKVTLPLHLQRGVSTREIWKNFLLVSVKCIFDENLLHKLLTFVFPLVVYYVEDYLFIYLFCFQLRSRYISHQISIYCHVGDFLLIFTKIANSFC